MRWMIPAQLPLEFFNLLRQHRQPCLRRRKLSVPGSQLRHSNLQPGVPVGQLHLKFRHRGTQRRQFPRRLDRCVAEVSMRAVSHQSRGRWHPHQ